MINDRFIIWYNRWLGRINEEADDSLWDEIEDELDFRETWGNISGKLDKYDKSVIPVIKKKSYLKEIIGIAASILIILATAKYISDGSQDISTGTDNAALTTRYIGQKIKTITDEALGQNGRGIIVAGLSGEGIHPEILPAESESGNQITGQSRMPDYDWLMALNIPAEKPPLTAYPLDNKRPGMTLADYSPVLYDMPASLSDSDGRSNFIGFKDAGLVFGYKNTWLLNHETYNGLNPSKLNSVLPTYRHEFGAATTLIIKQRTAFGLEFFWRSEVGQKYQQYINASYIDRSLNLDYLKLQTFYLFDPAMVPGEILLGGYYSLLKTGEETRGEDSFNIRKSYSDSDYGLLLGYQLNVNVHNRIILKPGLRFNYNLRNIFEGDYFVPSHLKKTNSFSAGFNISVAYRIL